MAAPAPTCTAVLSHKQRKAAERRERRRRKRQALAQARESEGEDQEIIVGDNENDDAAEEERQQQHEEWLERERLAQEEFRLRSEREEAVRKRKEEEERMIKEEWISQQKKEEEEKEKRMQEKRDREEAVQKMLDEAENQLDNGGPWMNPEAPVTTKSENFGTERDVAYCPFFLKTGACRFGERCSRKHVYPTSSPTLLVRGMFRTFGMEQSRRDDYDIDACLEHSEEELLESFIEFYHDVLPEFRSIGKVVQFKVCCNNESHLRGNVYVQFETEELCKEAFMKFNGRFYAGRQLQCEICPVTRWKNAICGLFDRRKCPKGKNCNFLHVFRNPGNEFWEADRDLRTSPDHSSRMSRRDEWHSERYRERSWRQNRYSRSPVRSERSYSRREDGRDRSRERRTSRQRRSGYSERRRRSRSRSRSRSKEREHHRSRNGGKDESKSRNRRQDELVGEVRERSKSTSREKKKKSRERSSKKADKGKKSHKQSKKSKKKRKKKSPEVRSSSGESEKESEEETVNNSSTYDPSNDPPISSDKDCFISEVTQEENVHEQSPIHL